MFHFPWFSSEALCIQTPVPRHYSGRVPPFGHPRIKACLPLPGAYRSLLRPSSPSDAKASIVRPYTLDQEILTCWPRKPEPASSSRLKLLYPYLCNCQRTNRLAAETRSLNLETGAIPSFKCRTSNSRSLRPAFPVKATEGILLSPAASEGWGACLESNQGPCPYQGHALTN